MQNPDLPPAPGCERLRILFVDDDEAFRRLFAELLSFWGWQPFVVTGQGQQLLDRAVEMAHKHRCHLALVDMRLIDNSNREDTSGLDLVQRIKPTESIILSAYPDPEAIRESIKEHGAYNFISKNEDTRVIKDELDKAAEQFCLEYRGVVCEPRETLRSYRQYFYPNDPDIPENEVSEVLARLFPRARRLQVKQLESTGRQSQSQAPRPRSMVLLVTADNLQPQIVKMARAAKIRKEVERYQQYIAERLVGSYSPPIKEWAVLWDIGGAAYPFLGSRRVVQFSAFYRNNPAEPIIHSLRQFFTGTWSHLYEDARKNTHERVNLFKAYCDVWDDKWYSERLAAMTVPRIEHPLAGNGAIQIPNPVAWLKDRVRRLDSLPTTALAVTHGDLHGANMLVDEAFNIWGIDFERSGPGPILQDFAELEIDILLRLSGLRRDDYAGLYQLAIWAARPQKLTYTPLPKQAEQLDPGIYKSMKVIAQLRRLASQCSGETDAQPYLWGLLLNALFRASLLARQGSAQQLRRTLMFSSILCHRLDHWEGRWPPADWTRR